MRIVHLKTVNRLHKPVVTYSGGSKGGGGLGDLTTMYFFLNVNMTIPTDLSFRGPSLPRRIPALPPPPQELVDPPLLCCSALLIHFFLLNSPYFLPLYIYIKCCLPLFSETNCGDFLSTYSLLLLLMLTLKNIHNHLQFIVIIKISIKTKSTLLLDRKR